MAQGARPSQPGPRSRAAAQKHGGSEGGEETLPNRCVVPELDPGGRALPVPKHLPPTGPAASPDPPFSSPLAASPELFRKNVVEGKRMENQEVWGVGGGGGEGGGGTYQT